jgi:hypothetical protein
MRLLTTLLRHRKIPRTERNTDRKEEQKIPCFFLSVRQRGPLGNLRVHSLILTETDDPKKQDIQAGQDQAFGIKKMGSSAPAGRHIGSSRERENPPDR